jgi:hypothetical protein
MGQPIRIEISKDELVGKFIKFMQATYPERIESAANEDKYYTRIGMFAHFAFDLFEDEKMEVSD